MAERMTIDERIARDGDRWRYIRELENELEKARATYFLMRLLVVVSLCGLVFTIFMSVR